MPYSQNDEEKYILEHTKETGRFLDIGAADGVVFSNTRSLYARGWDGVLVEPNFTEFSRLACEYNDPERIKLVNVGLAPVGGFRKFYSSIDMVSTTSQSHYDLWKNTAKYKEIYVRLAAVDEFFEYFPGPYQFINLDVEGENFSLLQKLPLDELGCECLCVEFEDHESQILQFLSGKWMSVYRSSENHVLIRR